MSLPETADVLIVGAGPTGLVHALALQQNGCSNVVIVDVILQGENTSRAVAVHAATIEALDIIGCGDALVNEGKKVSKTCLWVVEDGTKIETAYFRPLAKYTKHPFLLAIPQHVTEKVLARTATERGIQVLRPHKVVDMKPNAQDHLLTDVIFENGHILRTRCVVGADGARSTIRRLANVGWADPEGGAEAASKPGEDMSNMIIADVTLNAPPPILESDAINLIVSNDNNLLFISLPNQPYPEATSEPVYRVSCAIPEAWGPPPSAPDTAYVQRLLDLWGPNRVLPKDTPRLEITKTVWSSRFRTHSSIADRFFTHVPAPQPGGEEGGPVMLLGDAAHIHPPMGGQGMNLGIRDAVKLAPILAEYVRTSASASSPAERRELEAPLAQWGVERRQRALTVIALVKQLQRMLWIPYKRMYFLGFIPYNPGYMRNLLMRFLTSFEWFRANSAYRVSGLGNA